MFLYFHRGRESGEVRTRAWRAQEGIPGDYVAVIRDKG